MSKELLRQLGENWYGEQWQAPLAREIGVGERSMRRWAAGTDPVPPGVWRDILSRLENRGAEANYYLGEVKSALGLIEVSGFQVWDQANGTMRDGPGKSTRARIARIGGTIVPSTVEWVSPDNLDVEGRLKPVPISPSQAGDGFQTHVTSGPRSGRIPPAQANAVGASGSTRIEGVGASIAAAVGTASAVSTATGVGASIAAAEGHASATVPPKRQPLPYGAGTDTSGSDVARMMAERQANAIAAYATGATNPITPPEPLPPAPNATDANLDALSGTRRVPFTATVTNQGGAQSSAQGEITVQPHAETAPTGAFEMRPEPGKFNFNPNAAELVLTSSPPQAHVSPDPVALHREMLSRIAVLEEVVAVLDARPAGPGHNHPPEPIEGVSFGDEDRQAIAAALSVLKAQHATPTASPEINNAINILRAISDRLWVGMVRAGAYSAKQLDSLISEAAKSAGTEIGKRLVQSPFWWALITSLIAVSEVASRWIGSLPH